MSNSLKIGAVSGLIAGLVSGIVILIFLNIGNVIGLPIPWVVTPPPFSDIAFIHIVLGVIWGTILGIIYSKAKYVIPGRGVSKGLIFGMIIFLIYSIRTATFSAPYGFILAAASFVFIGFPTWIAYGLVLGVVYEFLLSRYYVSKEEPKIIEYDVKSGIQPGAIAGAIGGIVAFISFIPVTALVWKLGPIGLEFSFLIAQAGTHIGLNTLWGAVFGAMFTKVYNLIPGKGIIKGLYYALTVFLITSFHSATYNAAYATFQHVISMSFVGFFQAVTFGLVLGYLYKK